MPLIPPAGGAQRVFLASAAAFLLVAAFPSSAGWRVFFLITSLGALGWQAARAIEPLRIAQVPRPFAVAACAWTALAVASLAWSVDAGYTLQELRREIVYGALAFVVFFAGTRTPRELHAWMGLLFAATVVLAIGEWLRMSFPASPLFERASMGPGPFSTHLVIVAPLMAVALWPAPVGMGRGIRFAVALAAALVLAGIAGDSRILWPALLAAALVAFAAFVLQTPRDHPGRRAARHALAASIVLLPLLMAVSSEYKLRVYPRASGTFDSFSFDERPLIWSTAARAFVERPLLGHGYGREIVAARLRADLAKAGQATPYNHGHNVFLDAAIQMGVAGLAAFAGLVACLAWAFLEARRKAGGAALSIAGLALVTGYFTKNMTDDFFFRPNSLVFWAVSGMLLGLAARLPPAASRPSRSESR